jgi:hypothetical protein
VRFPKCSTSRPEPTDFRRQLRATTGVHSGGHRPCLQPWVHPFSDGLITKRSSGQQIEWPEAVRAHPSTGRARTHVLSLSVGCGHPPRGSSASQPFPPTAVIKVGAPICPGGLVGAEVVDSQGVRRIESARLPPLLGVLCWASWREKGKGKCVQSLVRGGTCGW